MSYYSGFYWPTYDYSYSAPVYSPPPYYYEPPAYVYTPPAYVYTPPPPAYDYTFSPPNYGYTPPSYGYTPPDYGYTPPSYVYTPPSFTYTPTYSPPDYGYSTPSWMTPPPSYSGFDSDPYDFSSTTSPYSYESTYFPDIVYPWSPTPESRYNDAYDAWSERSIATGDPYGLMDPTNRTSDLYYEMRGAYTDLLPETYARLGESQAALAGYGVDPSNIGGYSYGDIGGGDIYSGISNLGAYDFGTDADYGTGYGSSSSSYVQPSFGGVQVAAIDPAFMGYGFNTMSDSTPWNPDLSQATTIPVQPQTLPAVEGGATSNIGVTPLADGSAVINTPDGSTVRLDNEQFNKLLSGDNSVLGAASNEDKPTERFGATTNVAKEELSLLDKTGMPDVPAVQANSRQGESTITNLTQPPVEDRVGTPVVKSNGIYDLPSTIGKGAPVEDYRINPTTGELEKYSVLNQQGLRSNLPSLDKAESNYSFSPLKPKQEGFNPDRIPANYQTQQKQYMGYDMYDEFGNPTMETTGNAMKMTGRQMDEILPENLRKYSDLDPDKEYSFDANGKLTPAYRNPDDLLYKVSPEVQKILDKGAAADEKRYTPAVEKALNASARGGGGGGGGGPPPPKQQQQQPAKKTNPLLLAMLAALAAKGSGGGGGGGAPANNYDLERARAELEKNRRAGSNAQRYYTGPGTVKKAEGGITSLSANPLGGYSDGGRLLRGPGDGVSDSIPATIGKKQPARLADGEFVVPARIVSELGNGSTEAGARKLYAMMDRVQKARKKTVGKGKVAHNSRADKYLPK